MELAERALRNERIACRGASRIWSPVVLQALTVAAYYQLHVTTGRALPPMTWHSGAERTLEARSLG